MKLKEDDVLALLKDVGAAKRKVMLVVVVVVMMMIMIMIMMMTMTTMAMTSTCDAGWCDEARQGLQAG